MNAQQAVRYTTGDTGLDLILRGGLLRQGIHIIAGPPGTGKTVLSQQIGFHLASQGLQVVTLTALSETHERMLSHMEGFSFYDPKLVGSKVYYLSASRTFIEQGLLPSLQEVRHLISSPRADVMIFEGLSAIAEFATDETELRRFLFELNTHLLLLGCTGLFTADYDPLREGARPEFALADTIMLLHRREMAQRHIREIELLKTRGSESLLGRHIFEITGQGVTVYPRLEAVEGHALPDTLPETTEAFGVEGLDSMLGGGVPTSSTSILMGAPGSAKTLLGAQFVTAGAQQGQPGLIWSFQEPPEIIIRKMAGIGVDLRSQVETGMVKVLWRPPLELLIDKEFYFLLQQIEEHKIQRLFIDTFDPFAVLANESQRTIDIMVALSNSLRYRMVTSLLAVELPMLASNEISIGRMPTMTAADNIVLLRYTQNHERIDRTLTVLKKRQGSFDTTIRSYHITGKGFMFDDTAAT